MKRQPTVWSVIIAGAIALLASTLRAPAQSADAIIDKLVEKGILTQAEARALREEADVDFTHAHQVKTGMPDWVNALKINGDFRGRFEGFYADNPNFSERNRFRYRARLGFTVAFTNSLEAGLRLGSGDLDNAADLRSGSDPISNNQTFQNNAAKHGVFIDLAYGKWAPLLGDLGAAAFTIGKMENPFVFSDMVFDRDYTPEGAAAQFNFLLNHSSVTPQQLKVNLGGFVLDEISGSSDDPFMLGAQVRWDATWMRQESGAQFLTSIGVAGMTIENEEGLGATASQSLAPGGSGYVTNTVYTFTVPNINSGNSRTPTGSLVHEFNPVVVDASATYIHPRVRYYSGPFPIRLEGEYLNNPGAAQDNQGYWVGIQFGKSGKAGTWDVAYRWKHLESDAWYEEMVDSDYGAYYQTAKTGSGIRGYGAGTNVRGHIIRANYTPWNPLTIGLTAFLTELIDVPPPNVDSSMTRIQVDMIWKF